MIVRERSDSLTRLDGIRVVVVDDAPIIRRFLSAALEAVRRECPDMLISGPEMPGKGGHWLIGQVPAPVSAGAGLAPCGRRPPRPHAAAPLARRGPGPPA